MKHTFILTIAAVLAMLLIGCETTAPAESSTAAETSAQSIEMTSEADSTAQPSSSAPEETEDASSDAVSEEEPPQGMTEEAMFNYCLNHFAFTWVHQPDEIPALEVKNLGTQDGSVTFRVEYFDGNAVLSTEDVTVAVPGDEKVIHVFDPGYAYDYNYGLGYRLVGGSYGEISAEWDPEQQSS